MLYDKPLDSLTEEDIQRLITEGVQEGKQLEYKEALPGNGYDDKKEFLADVSSLANSAGGDIVFGIREQRDANGKTTGVPASPLTGIEGMNLDFEVRRLESLLRDTVKPRILGINFKEIPLSNGNAVLVLRVPRSWTPYHVVDFQGHWRFYSRNAAGKYPMDVTEVRNAIVMSDTLAQRLQEFRLERLAKIAAGETPVPLMAGAKVVLHIMPLSMMDPTRRIDVAKVKPQEVPPLNGGVGDYLLNVDGRLTFTGGMESTGYAQIFRSGAIEAVDASMLHPWNGDRRTIPSVLFEREIVEATGKYLRLVGNQGVGAPAVLSLSLLGVKGYTMAVNPQRFPFGGGSPVDRDDLILPETVVEDLSTSADQVLKPSFDILWNACGWPRSLNYDENGVWRGGH